MANPPEEYKKNPLTRFTVRIKTADGRIIEEKIGRAIDENDAAQCALGHHPGGTLISVIDEGRASNG